MPGLIDADFIKVWMLRFGMLAGERRKARDVVATLALSLCRLRGVPPPSDREFEALLKSPAKRTGTEVPATREARIDELIRHLDRLILERTRR